MGIGTDHPPELRREPRPQPGSSLAPRLLTPTHCRSSSRWGPCWRGAGGQDEEARYPLSLLSSHRVEPSGRGHRDGWGSGGHAEVGKEVGLLPAREAGRVGAGGVSPTATLVCSLAAERGDKDKVGATWKPPSAGPGHLRSPLKDSATGQEPGHRGLCPSPPGLYLLPTSTLGPMSRSCCPSGAGLPGALGCTRSSRKLAEARSVVPPASVKVLGAPLGTKGPFLRRGRGWEWRVRAGPCPWTDPVLGRVWSGVELSGG